MSGRNKKKKIPWMQYLMLVFMMMVGGICGYGMANYIDVYLTRNEDGNPLMLFVVLILGLYLAILLQIVLHEGGHLLFGLLTGYQFSSFRIGSFMLIKENRKLKVKRFSLAGTGGQCLMEPPELVNGRIPYVLYNLGGSIVNTISGIIFILIYMILPEGSILTVVLFCLAVVGFAFALINGIPMRLGTVNNDGYNALSLGKDTDALRAFWVQMKANEQISKGKRLKDMPEEWFSVPSETNMKNSMIATIGVFACNRLIDEHRFEEAAEQIEGLLGMETAIVGLHRNLLICDLAYCEMIGENRRAKIEKLLDKQQKKFMKSMKKFPSVIRTEYAYALMYENNQESAEKIKTFFEKVAVTYPYQTDIKSERELFRIGEETYKESPNL